MRTRDDPFARPGSNGRPAALACYAFLACCAATLLTLSQFPVRAQQFDYDPDGYWKMPSPADRKGEFNGEDPIGLASRQHIPTDCAIQWKDEGGKIYCFSSAMSSQVFQDERMSILAKATAFWSAEHPSKPVGSSRPSQSKDAGPAPPSQR